jgi:hypothetical protein
VRTVVIFEVVFSSFGLLTGMLVAGLQLVRVVAGVGLMPIELSAVIASIGIWQSLAENGAKENSLALFGSSGHS